MANVVQAIISVVAIFGRNTQNGEILTSGTEILVRITSATS